jgi:RIO kinase 1
MAAPRSSRRRRFDDAEWEPSHHDAALTDSLDAADLVDGADDRADRTDRDTDDVRDDVDPAEPTWSTYRDARRGPGPVPDWVVTDPRAIDTDRGVLKTGKEADVSLVERAVPGGPACLLAAKRYRSAEHRLFHRDAGYLEGRPVRRSREMRAMATRTDFGRELIAGQWAAAEFEVLSRLWSRGAAVPYPVQLLGTEVMMELIGDADGTAAPRLAQLRPGRQEALDLWHQAVEVLTLLAELGYAHGDLSPYNVLVHRGRLVLIDLPQAVDLVGNPQGFAYLERDCRNLATWFAAHGLPAIDADAVYADLRRRTSNEPA